MFSETQFPSPNAIASNGSIVSADGRFDSGVAAIKAAYGSLGHTLGWRFLTGPKATLSSGADIGFITLNPGGNSEPPDHPNASCEGGNAYLTETWPGSFAGVAPLQRQVQMLFTQLKAKLGYQGSLREFMDSEVMSAYFIPFRSPSIAALPRYRESLAFAVDLWSGILQSWTPRCIITIDTVTFGSISKLLSARPGARVVEARRFPTGWGDYEADTVQIAGLREDGVVTIARLPHLSRFQLFGSPVRAPQLDAFMEYLASQMKGNEPTSKESSMHPCQRIVAAAKYLESNGFTQAQLSSIHHDSLKGRSVTFNTAYKYFGEHRELKDRNLDYGNRLAFIADQYKAGAGRFSDLIALALKQWPLRST
jgi:hypothetical protein